MRGIGAAVDVSEFAAVVAVAGFRTSALHLKCSALGFSASSGYEYKRSSVQRVKVKTRRKIYCAQSRREPEQQRSREAGKMLWTGGQRAFI